MSSVQGVHLSRVIDWPPVPQSGIMPLVTDWPFRANDGVPSPEIVAAWAQLGLLPAEKVPLWAAYWLVAGYDGEHLVHLAGLHGDDPHDVRDTLPAALGDCGAGMPESDLAAATVIFAQLARMHVEGAADAQRVGQKTEEVLIRSGYPESIMALPLGRLYCIADEWGASWGRTNEELAQVVREACEEQLRNSSVTADHGDGGATPPANYQEPATAWLVEYTDNREPGSRFQAGAFTTEAEARKLLDRLSETGTYGKMWINMVPVHQTVEDWEWDR
jgi:hypothetical protein